MMAGPRHVPEGGGGRCGRRARKGETSTRRTIREEDDENQEAKEEEEEEREKRERKKKVGERRRRRRGESRVHDVMVTSRYEAAAPTLEAPPPRPWLNFVFLLCIILHTSQTSIGSLSTL